jgi:hypothetical protein
VVITYVAASSDRVVHLWFRRNGSVGESAKLGESFADHVLYHCCAENLIRLGTGGLAWEAGPLCSGIYNASGIAFPHHIWASPTMGSGTPPCCVYRMLCL